MPEAPKDLNMSETYVDDILQGMFNARYAGLKIAVSCSAMRELMHECKSIDDVVDILEHGRDAPRRRKRGTLERWLDKGDKTFNAVIVKDHDACSGTDCWVLIHLGKFGRK